MLRRKRTLIERSVSDVCYFCNRKLNWWLVVFFKFYNYIFWDVLYIHFIHTFIKWNIFECLRNIFYTHLHYKGIECIWFPVYNPLHIITKIQPMGACLIYRYGGSSGPELSYVTPHELIIYLESTQRKMQVPHLICDTLDESAQSGRCILNSIIYLTI